MKSVAILLVFLGGVYSELFPGISGNLTTPKLIRRHRYKCEVHEVQTKDGYKLTLHRIPHGSAEKPNPDVKKEVVFCMHGFLCTSSDFVLIGPNTSLPFLLVEEGYDVWLGNARGNTYSTKHETKSPQDPSFWDFSWHEIGLIDIPCMIKYILNHTGQAKLHYIGHSQGCTTIFALNSLRPKFGEKFLSINLMAPVVFVANAKSRSLAAMATLLGHGTPVEGLVRKTPFLPNTKLMQLLGLFACQETSPTKKLCENALFLMGGVNDKNLNKTAVSEIVQTTPGGASTGQTIHFAQMRNSDKFCQYDYGPLENKEKYGQTSPPSYPLDQYFAKTYVYYSNGDHLTHVLDVERLKRELNPKAEVHFHNIKDKSFAHLDFLYGCNVLVQVYSYVIKNIKLSAAQA